MLDISFVFVICDLLGLGALLSPLVRAEPTCLLSETRLIFEFEFVPV